MRILAQRLQRKTKRALPSDYAWYENRLSKPAVRKLWMDAPTLNGIECQSGGAEQPLKRMGASTMKITTVGIDLAKNVFQCMASMKG